MDSVPDVTVSSMITILLLYVVFHYNQASWHCYLLTILTICGKNMNTF